LKNLRFKINAYTKTVRAMARLVFRGRRLQVTFPQALFDQIEEIATKETKSLSAAVMELVAEGIKARSLSKLTPGNDSKD
jgi:predicted DNA-binding ribbon-helix-helix protein